MRVLFYGRLADAIAPELDVAAMPGASVAAIRTALLADYPDAADVLQNKRARTCVEDRLVGDDYQPAAGETLEFLAPVSGG